MRLPILILCASLPGISRFQLSQRSHQRTFCGSKLVSSWKMCVGESGEVSVSCLYMQRIKLILKYLFAVFFALAGFNHFFNTAFYLKIMPPFLPWHLLLVYLSGVIEIVLGVLLLIPKLTRAAAWGLIALLIAIFPVNINMALNQQLYPEYSVTALWIRLPLQFVLIAWAYWYTLPVDRGLKDSEAVTA